MRAICATVFLLTFALVSAKKAPKRGKSEEDHSKEVDDSNDSKSDEDFSNEVSEIKGACAQNNGLKIAGGRSEGKPKLKSGVYHAKFSCDCGYRLRARKLALCNPELEKGPGSGWHFMGACDQGRGNLNMQCPAPTIAGGSVRNGGSHVGTVRKFECNRGFEVSGRNKLNCATNGNWFPEGTCAAKNRSSPSRMPTSFTTTQPSTTSSLTPSPQQDSTLTSPKSARSFTNTKQCICSGEDSPELISAILDKDVATVRSLLASGKASYDSSDGWEPAFVLAAQTGSTAMLALFLNCTTCFSINGAGSNGVTALMVLAGQRDQPRILELMIRAGANVTAEDDSGNQALHYAAQKGRAENFKLLLKRGASVEATNRARETPLQLAKQEGHGVLDNLLLFR